MQMLQHYLYLLCAISFIVGIARLSNIKHAPEGNYIAAVGMALAIIACIFGTHFSHKFLAIACITFGGGIGIYFALKMPITKMPELVAAFHSLVGLAATLVAYATFISPEYFNIGQVGYLSRSFLMEVSLDAIIGAVTFTGSVIAFAKLNGSLKARTDFINPMVTITNLVLILIAEYYFLYTQSPVAFVGLILLAAMFGAVMILPVGGADMPVIVSMLNSYSGWTAAGVGFTLSNNLLIITGSKGKY